MIAWLRYRILRALALPQPDDWDETRYPRTVAGGWRHFREQAAPAEVDWYESRQTGGPAAAGRPSAWWTLAGNISWIVGFTTGQVLLTVVGVVVLAVTLVRWFRRVRYVRALRRS